MTSWKEAEKKAKASWKKAIKNGFDSNYHKDLLVLLDKEVAYLEEALRFEKKYRTRGSTVRGSRSTA